MKFIVIGLNHKTAPVAIREQFCFTDFQEEYFLSELKRRPDFYEGFLLSTCNRTELYTCVIDEENIEQELYQLFLNVKKTDTKIDFRDYFYTLRDEDAIEHLFQVACGLDSMVVGEKQILGQLKDQVEIARQKQSLGKYLNVLTQTAIRAGKKAQHETKISYGGSSVGWAAVALAEKQLDSLVGKSVLVLGAGKMSELALKNLKSRDPKTVYIMNRTVETAQELADQFGYEVVPFCDIKEVLSEVDLCISSAGAPFYIIEKTTVEKALSIRSNRPLIFIDISVPRNVSPSIADLEEVLLFGIDDLDQVVKTNLQTRLTAIEDVKGIIEQKQKEFSEKIQKIEDLTSV